VVVGYTATAMLTVLPRIVRRFRAEHPRVRVALREMSSAPQLEALAAGSLDVALVGDLLLLGREDAVAFWPDRLVLAMPAEHPAAMRRHVSPGARPSVNGSPLVLFPREQSPGLFDAILALCARLGLEPEVTQHAQSWHMILALVGAGLGVSVVPAAVRRLRVPGVRFVDIGPSPTEVGVTLCVRGGAAPTAAAFAAVGRTVDWP
jgi:DNA-binding transcriptional LysR family regulator